MTGRFPMQAAVCLLLIAAASGNAATFDFNRDIRPILSDKCFQCHGPDSAHRAADLRLDDEEAAKADLDGYRAIDVNSPRESELLARIYSDDEFLVMPPPEAHKELSANEKAKLKAWIEAGAPWSRPWAYVEPKRTSPPDVKANDQGTNSRAANWIDAFVVARLEQEGVSPARRAQPVTLIRRLAFDLTGMPPDQRLVDRYVADPTDATYEQVVDELLASSRYGERMAIYWLDLVRYADTVGYHGDQDQTVWPYRDYVIHAFNSNKPFDKFTIEQLAGDMLPDAGTDEKIASAYNRLLQTTHEGGLQLKEYRSVYLADRVRNVSQVWMGATLGCAQCHDHKFDPLTAQEFYALGAFFADIDDEEHMRRQGSLNTLPTPREPQLPVQSYYQRKRLERLDKAIDQLDPKQDENLMVSLQKMRRDAAEPAVMPISKSGKPREVRLLPRGNWQDESGPIIQPTAPAALGWKPTNERASRLDLARWLVQTGPTKAGQGAGLLTSRVMVNRFWYLLFGEGIATVLDDFGGQGQPPTHPELLDNLAVEFVESGWDVKHIMKLIVMSSTYRQSSVGSEEMLARDPNNQLLARQGRYRLSAEIVRDTALTASGLLVEKLGGPSGKPYQPAGYYEHLNFPRRKYETDKNTNQWRRGLYTHWQRQFLHPMLKAFDAPSREECTAKRSRSRTPLASLVLLNDPTFVEAARAFALDMLTTIPGDDKERINTLYRRVTSRPADDFEQGQVRRLIDAQLAHYTKHPDQAEALLGVGMKGVPEEIDKRELAAWTFACRAVLNLGEAFNRN